MRIFTRTLAAVLLLSILAAPAASALSVFEVDYDHDDKKIEFDFDSRVKYRKCKVVITDAVTNRKVALRLGEKDNDELSVNLGKRLVLGRAYRYKITNIAPRATGVKQTLTGTFIARDWD